MMELDRMTLCDVAAGGGLVLPKTAPSWPPKPLGDGFYESPFGGLMTRTVGFRKPHYGQTVSDPKHPLSPQEYIYGPGGHLVDHQKIGWSEAW